MYIFIPSVLFLCRAWPVDFMLFLFSGTIFLPFLSLGLHSFIIHLLMVAKPISIHIPKFDIFSFQTLFMCIFSLALSPSPFKSFPFHLPAPLNPLSTGYISQRPHKVSPTSCQSVNLYLSRLVHPSLHLCSKSLGVSLAPLCLPSLSSTLCSHLEQSISTA